MVHGAVMSQLCGAAYECAAVVMHKPNLTNYLYTILRSICEVADTIAMLRICCRNIGDYRASYLRYFEVSTTTASMPPAVPKLT